MLKITRTWSTFLVDFLQDFPHHRISGNQSSLSESDLPGPQLTVVAQTDLCFWKLDSSTYENLWTNTILRGFSIFGKFTILRGFSIFGKFTILRGFSIFWKNVYIYIYKQNLLSGLDQRWSTITPAKSLTHKLWISPIEFTGQKKCLRLPSWKAL